MTGYQPQFDVTPCLSQDEGQHFDRKSLFHGPSGGALCGCLCQRCGGVADGPVQVTGDGFPVRIGDQTIETSDSKIRALRFQGLVESYEGRS